MHRSTESSPGRHHGLPARSPASIARGFSFVRMMSAAPVGEIKRKRRRSIALRSATAVHVIRGRFAGVGWGRCKAALPRAGYVPGMQCLGVGGLPPHPRDGTGPLRAKPAGPGHRAKPGARKKLFPLPHSYLFRTPPCSRFSFPVSHYAIPTTHYPSSSP